MNKKYSTIGVDVGGTKIYAARFDITGKIEEERQVPTPNLCSSKKMIQTLIRMIEEIFPAEEKNVKKIGIGWPGIIHPKIGRVEKTPNIFRIKNVDIAKAIEEEFEIPTQIENDANCFALAEAKVQNKKNIVGVIIGTGLGGGIIKNGEIVRGETGEEGEFAPLLWKNGKSFQNILAGKTHFLFKKTGNKKWQNALADLLQIIVEKYNPEEIIFGGSVAKNILSQTSPLQKERRKEIPLLEEIQKKFTEKLQKKGIQNIPKLKISTLKNAGAFGASML